MTSPFSIYILIGLTYPDYKAEPFAAYIDSGSGICLSKPACFPEEYHYRRGLGLIVVKRQMESALKRPFRSYGKSDRLGSIMISVDCRATPDSAKRFLLKKIHMIEEGEILSSQNALDYVQNRLTEESHPQRFRRQG